MIGRTMAETAVFRTTVAPAKINLNLHVLGRQPGGFHQLQSLVVFVSAADRITLFSAQGNSGADEFQLSGRFARELKETRSGNDNLVMVALCMFRQIFPDAVPFPLGVKLEKNLPVASGIGGGSADAAATLRLLDELSLFPLDQKELLNLAARLGSDVPVCLKSGTTFMSGRGEKLEPAPLVPPFALLLVNPCVPISTPRIFQNLKCAENPPFIPFSRPFENLEQLVAWLENTRNDLQAPATDEVPQIANILASVTSLPRCVFSAMSGSGATVFGIFSNLDDARAAALVLKRVYPAYWIEVATNLP